MKGTQETQVKTKNNTKAILHFIAIILTVITMISIAIGLFAWSKYTATQSGNATAQVAKWNFNLSLQSGGTPVTAGSSLDLATTLDEPATHVADGKIAPGTSGTFDIVIDTSGTEVSMVYDVTITMENCPRNITFSKKGPGENNFTVISAAKTGDVTERARTISFSKYLRAKDENDQNENGVKTETIKWEWPYELTGNDPATNQPYTEVQKTEYDSRDNADQGRTVTLNITAVGAEVMNAPLSEATITYGDNKTVANGGTIKLLTTDESITLIPTSGSEAVTFSSSNTGVATVASSETVQNGVVVSPAGAGSTVITLTGQETEKQIQINITIDTPGTPVSELTKDNYGQYVNLGTKILSTYEEGVTLPTLSSQGTLGGTVQADWRVFYKDNEGGVWLILADYMPNSSFDVSKAGLEAATESNYTTYGVRSTVNRAALLNGLEGKIANKNWNELLTGSSLLNGTTLADGVKVQGAVDLETWVASWNEKCTPELFTNTNATGYYIGANENPASYSYSVSNSNRLYFPHTNQPGYNDGYWLASPSARGPTRVVYVGYGGNVDYNYYSNSDFGVRPAVYLPSTVKLNTNNTVWTIQED